MSSIDCFRFTEEDANNCPTDMKYIVDSVREDIGIYDYIKKNTELAGDIKHLLARTIGKRKELVMFDCLPGFPQYRFDVCEWFGEEFFVEKE